MADGKPVALVICPNQQDGSPRGGLAVGGMQRRQREQDNGNDQLPNAACAATKTPNGKMRG